MRTDTHIAEKIGSLYFDENTILEVEQKGGGGSGVQGLAGVTGGLAARNLITGESTGEVIEEQAATIEEQAGTIEEQAATIEEQAGTIEEQAEALINQKEVGIKYFFNILNLTNQSCLKFGCQGVTLDGKSYYNGPLVELSTTAIGAVYAEKAPLKESGADTLYPIFASLSDFTFTGTQEFRGQKDHKGNYYILGMFVPAGRSPYSMQGAAQITFS